MNKHLLFVLISLGFFHFTSSQDLGIEEGDLPPTPISAVEARNIATKAYLTKANIGPKTLGSEAQIFILGFDVDGFAKKGDPIWTITFGRSLGDYLGMIWVHTETGEIYFVHGPWVDLNKGSEASR
ncbi:MAG: hypothetical protein Q7P63_14340 [Verrucomicrobiota bacterium JB022]|nr:hypothetical protein [Verrucomicrobiota bacterium JB022]